MPIEDLDYLLREEAENAVAEINYLDLVSEGERPVGIIQSYRIGDDPEYLDDRWMVGAPPDEVSID